MNPEGQTGKYVEYVPVTGFKLLQQGLLLHQMSLQQQLIAPSFLNHAPLYIINCMVHLTSAGMD